LPTKLRQDIYARGGSSMLQRFTLSAMVAGCTALAWWLLLGSGLTTVGAWFGHSWLPGNPLRRLCLAIALSIYFIRLLFTQFVFVKRGVSWGEASGIAFWILFIYLLLALLGGSFAQAFGIAGYMGIVFFLAGSWMNTYAEYARHVWKRQPENRGQLYTLGLFRYSRHPNYFGDLLSFSGLCLISGRWETGIIPAIMLAGFVFVNVPMLDRHLHSHYGEAFEAWARHTKKLIPFVY
jgi:protein-S-isoprenylcysteine O-methyltransferase Ste14